MPSAPTRPLASIVLMLVSLRHATVELRSAYSGLCSRFANVLTTSLGTMRERYVSVVASDACPNWRWMIGIGTPSISGS